MGPGGRPPYEVVDYEVVAETPELRMLVLTLAQGQGMPWHWHSNITDRFFCMWGPMVVEIRAPREIFELNAGDTCAVPPKRAHPRGRQEQGPLQVRRSSGCRHLLFQSGRQLTWGK